MCDVDDLSAADDDDWQFAAPQSKVVFLDFDTGRTLHKGRVREAELELLVTAAEARGPVGQVCGRRWENYYVTALAADLIRDVVWVTVVKHAVKPD